MAKRYVVGFAFDSKAAKVVLITKNRPAWQAGLLNGVGGHIEQGEQPLDAMVREFWEETGVTTDKSNWKQYGKIYNDHFTAYAYVMFNDAILTAVSKTDEEISIRPVSELFREESQRTIPNLSWLIPAAIDT